MSTETESPLQETFFQGLKKWLLWTFFPGVSLPFLLIALYYGVRLYDCYPYSGDATSVIDLREKNPERFRMLPGEFDSFPVVDEKIEWKYNNIWLDVKCIYGKARIKEIEEWCKEHSRIFENGKCYFEDNGSIEKYCENNNSYKTSEYFSLPHSGEKFFEIAHFPREGRMQIYLYISENNFIIYFG